GDGTMVSISASPEVVEPLLAGTPVVIAGYNSPQQTVVSGPVAACEEVGARAGAQGLFWTRIAVSHAFHSEAVAPAAVAFGEHLSGVSFAPLARTMVSTVTGDVLPADADVAALLRRPGPRPPRRSPPPVPMAPVGWTPWSCCGAWPPSGPSCRWRRYGRTAGRLTSCT